MLAQPPRLGRGGGSPFRSAFLADDGNLQGGTVHSPAACFVFVAVCLFVCSIVPLNLKNGTHGATVPFHAKHSTDPGILALSTRLPFYARSLTFRPRKESGNITHSFGQPA